MTASSEPDPRIPALRLILDNLPVLHRMVIEEIGHPLPPDLISFVRDWLDTAIRAVERDAPPTS